MIVQVLARRASQHSQIVEWRDAKVIYRRYAAMYFCFVVDADSNELLTLEVIDRYVVLLDRYFGSVCELDLVIAFDKAHYVLDELLVGGELHETSIVQALRALRLQDALAEDVPSWLPAGAADVALPLGGTKR